MISLILTYFRNPKALDWQLDFLESFPDFDFEIVVVDDGSFDGYPQARLSSTPLSGSLVTVERNIPWNIPGARNWGFAVAQSSNCLTTDIDHRPSESTLERLCRYGSTRGEALLFRRQNELGQEIHPHTDSFFIDKSDFWEIGGYDERLSGSYGQNARDFGSRAAAVIEIRQTDLLLETLSEHKTKSLGRSLTRNQVLIQFLALSPKRRIRRLRENVRILKF